MSLQTEQYTPEELKLELSRDIKQYGTGQYGVLYSAMVRLVQCESAFNQVAYNPKDSDGLPAIGLLQFKQATFYQFANKYGVKDAWVWNPLQQIRVATLMIRDGYAHLWGCSRIAGFDRLK